MNKDTMTGKYFYLPGHHKIVYVHDHKDKRLILGGRCNFIKDSKTSILRQSITESNFKRLRPKELNIETPEIFNFLENSNFGSWMVKMPHHDTGGSYIKSAEVLPHASSPYHQNGFMI